MWYKIHIRNMNDICSDILDMDTNSGCFMPTIEEMQKELFDLTAQGIFSQAKPSAVNSES